MFTETDGSRKTLGDVDVIYHDRVYRLLHLVLRNHGYIAHAVSTNAVAGRALGTMIEIPAIPADLCDLDSVAVVFVAAQSWHAVGKRGVCRT